MRKKIPLFLDLEEELISRINNAGVIKQYQPGEMIIWQEEECKSVFFINSGLVEVYRSSMEGREQIFDRLGTGEIFNLVPAMKSNSLNLSNARALEPTELFILGKEKFKGIIKQYPEVAVHLVSYLSQRLENMSSLAEQMALLQVPQRLAAFLIQQADHALLGKWTQIEIARRLGTVREVISRNLKDFSAKGLIRMEKNRIILLDRGKLEKFLGGGK